MRSAHVTVQGQHFCSLKSQCADVNDVSKHKQAVNSVNNAKAIRYKHTSAPNNALLAMAGAGNRGGSRRTRFHTMNFLMQSLGSADCRYYADMNADM